MAAQLTATVTVQPTVDTESSVDRSFRVREFFFKDIEKNTWRLTTKSYISTGRNESRRKS